VPGTGTTSRGCGCSRAARCRDVVKGCLAPGTNGSSAAASDNPDLASTAPPARPCRGGGSEGHRHPTARRTRFSRRRRTRGSGAVDAGVGVHGPARLTVSFQVPGNLQDIARPRTQTRTRTRRCPSRWPGTVHDAAGVGGAGAVDAGVGVHRPARLTGSFQVPGNLQDIARPRTQTRSAYEAMSFPVARHRPRRPGLGRRSGRRRNRCPRAGAPHCFVPGARQPPGHRPRRRRDRERLPGDVLPGGQAPSTTSPDSRCRSGRRRSRCSRAGAPDRFVPGARQPPGHRPGRRPDTERLPGDVLPGAWHRAPSTTTRASSAPGARPRTRRAPASAAAGRCRSSAPCAARRRPPA